MNIFITGGTSGLGLGLAKHYLREGHKVAVSSFESAAEVQGKIPNEVIYYQADVTDAVKMKEVVQNFRQNQGDLSLVIANVGISMDKKKLPDFERGSLLMQINVIGVINTLAPAVEIMKKQGFGHIVGIGSVSGLNGLPGMAFYGASKAAIINMFESFALDLPSYGISTTCLVPGFIRTPLTQNNKHKMPFLLSTEEAIAHITKAINSKKKLHVFPLPLKIVGTILRILPRRLYRLIMKFDLLGLAKE